MTTKELMVGDWVLMDMNYLEEDPMYTKTDYKPYKIQNGEDIDLACETNCIGDCDVYQPIPLTPEILEKNGFKECNKDTDGAIQYELGDESLGVDVWVNTEPCLLGAWRKSYPMINELPISFVHELQHCLNLVGIKKEIEL